MVAHFREYWLFGAFFLVVCPAQLVWAEAVRRDPDARRLLAVGLAGNLAVAALWVVTRTVGLPFGPNPGEAEHVHAVDLLATIDEVGIAIVCVLLLVRAHAVPGWVGAVAWALAGSSVLAALAGGGHA